MTARWLPSRSHLTPFGERLFAPLFPAGRLKDYTCRSPWRLVQYIIEPDPRDIWAWHGKPHQWRRYISVGPWLIRLRPIDRKSA